MELLQQMYLDDGLLVMLVMDSGDSNSAKDLADEYGLTFPILSDHSYQVFNRWNPSLSRPSTTFLREGLVVEEIGTIWNLERVEELLYGE